MPPTFSSFFLKKLFKIADMDLCDSLGLIPYNFEPQLSEEELVLLSSVRRYDG